MCAGIGSRLTRREKKQATDRAAKESNELRVYNCNLGPFQKDLFQSENDDSDSSSDDEITFAPDDYEPLVHKFKTNRFGLGYIGLNKKPILQQNVNLFAPFEVLDKKNKKVNNCLTCKYNLRSSHILLQLSITGQAFGVGAFEEDDDDIYAKEDLTAYDFSLADKAPEKVKAIVDKQNADSVSGFGPAKKEYSKKVNFVVNVPFTFKPRNWAVRKTRFSPAVLPEVSVPVDGTKRHMLTPEERGNILNDSPAVKPVEINQPKPMEINQPKTIAIEPITIDKTVQPPNENNEFIALENIKKESKDPPKPVALDKFSQMFGDRFVSEKKLLSDEKDGMLPSPPPLTKPIEILMKRTKITWSPCPLLCQRMNIAEPMSSKAMTANKSGSFSLFECLGKGTGSKNNRNRRSEQSREFTPAIKTDDENSTLLRMATSSRSAIAQEVVTKKMLAPTQVVPVVTAPSISVPSKIIPIVSQKPIVKSELELKILEAESKHPAEKKDIYKSIFDSSDEDDDGDNGDNDEPSVENNVFDITPSVSFTATHVVIPKLPKDVNILRNTSPPRGIFANFLKKDKTPPPPPPDTATKQTEPVHMDVSDVDEPDADMYGPSLPAKILVKESIPRHEFTKQTATKSNADRMKSIARSSISTERLSFAVPQIQASKSIEIPAIDDADEWIDNNDANLISSKKKKEKHHKKNKKHKKDKKSDKKSKSKKSKK